MKPRSRRVRAAGITPDGFEWALAHSSLTPGVRASS